MLTSEEMVFARPRTYLHREPPGRQLMPPNNLVPPVLGLGDFACKFSSTNGKTLPQPLNMLQLRKGNMVDSNRGGKIWGRPSRLHLMLSLCTSIAETEKNKTPL